jgi:hypothetical protein
MKLVPPHGSGWDFFWSALTCQRFGRSRPVAADGSFEFTDSAGRQAALDQSADRSAHSKKTHPLRRGVTDFTGCSARARDCFYLASLSDGAGERRDSTAANSSAGSIGLERWILNPAAMAVSASLVEA